MTDREAPTSSHEVLKNDQGYIQVSLEDLDTMREALTRPSFDTHFYRSPENSLPDPITSAEIRYTRESEADLQLHGAVEFDISAFTTPEDAINWQRTIRKDIGDALSSQDIEHVMQLHDQNTIYTEGKNNRPIRIRSTVYNENTCGIEVELLASEDLSQSGSNEDDTDLEQLTTFIHRWQLTLGALLARYNSEAPSTLITVAAPVDTTALALLPSPEREPGTPLALEMETSPEHGFKELGGLSNVKPKLQLMAQIFRHPEAARMYGVGAGSFILYGPAGTGKTTLRRSIRSRSRRKANYSFIKRYSGKMGR